MAELCGLYAITADTLTTDALIDATQQAILGGARIIQYRNKNLDHPQRLLQAKALLTLCRQHGTPLIINDDVKLAATIGADGVHLGRDDAKIQQARTQLGNRIIGISCYNEWPRARAAQEAGADYIAFGAFYPSLTKPMAVKAEVGLLERGKQELNIPIVAIGGITPENGAALVTAGADMLAIVDGVFGQTNIQNAARRYAELF